MNVQNAKKECTKHNVDPCNSWIKRKGGQEKIAQFDASGESCNGAVGDFDENRFEVEFIDGRFSSIAYGHIFRHIFPIF